MCQDEAGNEHHASSKEHCGEEKKGGALQRWTEIECRAKLGRKRPTHLSTCPSVYLLSFSLTLFSPISLHLSLHLLLLTLFDWFTDIQICTAQNCPRIYMKNTRTYFDTIPPTRHPTHVHTHPESTCSQPERWTDTCSTPYTTTWKHMKGSICSITHSSSNPPTPAPPPPHTHTP